MAAKVQRRPAARRRPRAVPLAQVDPRVLEAALRLAGGDRDRLQVHGATDVVVLNHSRKEVRVGR